MTNLDWAALIELSSANPYARATRVCSDLESQATLMSMDVMGFPSESAHDNTRSFCSGFRSMMIMEATATFTAASDGTPLAGWSSGLLASGLRWCTSPLRAARIAMAHGFVSRQPATNTALGGIDPRGCSKSHRVNFVGASKCCVAKRPRPSAWVRNSTTLECPIGSASHHNN